MNIIITSCYTLVLLYLVASLSSCGTGGEVPTAQDSVQYISPDFLGNDTKPTEETKPKKKKNKPKKERSNKATVGSPSVVSKEGRRAGDSAADFANAMKGHIIRMVYPDAYEAASTRVLNSDSSEKGWTIELEVVWKDRWVREPYRIKGILEVNKDGSNAEFKITEKNAEAEALEFTYENFKTTLQLDRI